MIIKNRIIACALSAVTLFGIPLQSSAFLDDIDDVPTKDIMAEESTAGIFSDSSILNTYTLLNYIGCITEPQESFEENQPVTKAYAAHALAVIATGSKAESVSEVVFSDVSETHEYASGISKALEAGIIDGAEKFYPNKNASAKEIADMAIRALNYDYIYGKKNALEKAIELDFFRGVSYSQDMITTGQFMIFLRNVLNTDHVLLSGVDGRGNAVVDVVGGVSQLEKYFGIYKQDGVITGYKYSSLYGDSYLDDGSIQINRGLFNINTEIPTEEVGAYVDAYVDGENDDLIVSMLHNERKTNICEFEKDAYYENGAKYISYFEENKTVKASVSDSAVVMYNNTYYGLYSDAEKSLIENSDKIMLIDNDGDKKYDVVKLFKYTYYLIKSVSQDRESIVFDKNGGSVEYDDNSYIEFTFAGEKIGLADLKSKDVLTVLETTRRDASRIFVAVITRDIEEGVISSEGDDDLGKYYQIGNEKYYLTNEYNEYIEETEVEKKPKIGDFIRIYLSYDNKIVAVMAEDDFFYGYIMSGAYDVDEEIVKFNIYSLEGEQNSYFFADKVRVYNESYPNGIKKEKMEAIEIYLDGDTRINNDVVGYSLNSNGEISAIVKPINRTAYSHGSLYYPLTFDYDGTGIDIKNFSTRIYREVYASKYKIASSVPILVIPEDDDLKKDVKAYGIKSSTSWGSEGKYVIGTKFKIYNCDKFYIPQFCTMVDEVELTMKQGDYGDLYMYCIDKIEHKIDENDVPVTQISYYHNGKLTQSVFADEVSFVNKGVYTDVDSVDELKKGDVIQIKTDSLGKIYLVSVLFSIADRPDEYGAYFKKEIDNQTVLDIREELIDTTSHDILIFYGKVIDINGDVALVNTSRTGRNEEHTYPVIIGNRVYKAVNYVIYNTNTKTVTPASLSEIQPNDTVLMRKYYNSIQDVIIIR